MANPSKPLREYRSAYFVQDRANLDEMTRQNIQDQMLTAGMGGVLPEQGDLSNIRRVLDVGCGTGCWLIELAKAYPNISLLIGVDASERMVEYARAQAEAEGVSDRVEFYVMDALLVLEFPDSYFDLVNQRLGNGWLRTWEWPKILKEYQRVTRWYGVIRITECDFNVGSSSPAMNRLYEITDRAFSQAGYCFHTNNTVVDGLARLMHQHRVQNVQTRRCRLEHRAGTVEGQRFYEDMKLAFRTALPFIKKWTRMPDDYEETYQQMLVELQQPDFAATWELLTAWGSKG